MVEDSPHGPPTALLDQRWREQWSRPWSSTGIKELGALALDRAGNLYVAGSLRQSKERITRMALLKYSKDGVLAWEHLKEIAESDHVNAVALDASANVYVTGTTGARLGTAPADGHFQVFLVKYSQEPSAPAASFDCLKAATPQEKLICQRPRLAALDRDLARAYEAELDGAKDKAAFKAEQSTWRKTVRDAGTTAEQLEASMTARLEELKARLARR